MSSYIIKFTNTSGESGTMIADAGFNYTDKLNAINDANIKITGSSTLKRSLIETGSQIFIYRNGTLEHHGLVNSVDFLDGGGISVLSQGYETWMAKENGDYAGSPWDNIASATIFSAVIGESNYFTAGTIEAGTNIDQRFYETDSLWNSLMNLRTKTSQDIGIDYANTEIDILDHKGSSTSVATFNSNIQIVNMRVSESYPLGNDVRVYGKGDGDNQIKSDSSTAGQDATSKSTYGTIRKIIRDPSVLTIDEADLLADALVAVYKDPVKIYDFDVINPNQNLVSGDVITLNAPSQGLNNEEVRIVRVERGVRKGNEYLTLQVTNKEYSLLLKNRNEVLAGIEKNFRDQQTYMQGTTNVLTFSQQINATSAAPLRTQGNLPASFIIDEAGNNRVNSFTCDYDVDPFRSSVGTASVTESNKNPSISGSTNSTDTLDFYDSVSISVTPGSSAWYFSLLSGLSLPSYSSDEFVQISVRIAAGEYISSGMAGYTEFLLTDNNYDNYQGYLSTYKGGYSIANGDYLLNQSFILDDWSSGSCEYAIGTDVYGYDLDIDVEVYRGYRDHPHSSLSGNAANHLHDVAVSIGDAVSDAGSLNATQVSIYVDFWNGSSWVQKHSILNTGKTLETDVDISNGGALPDASGFWRTRIYTNSANADLVNGIMKVKHALDT